MGNIQAQGNADKENILAQQLSQGAREQGNIRAQGKADKENIGAQGDQDVRKIGAQGTEDRANIGAQTDADVTKMEKGDELEAKKSNRQSARARSLARSF